MNQILFTQDKRNSNSQDTKKIVLFFSVSLIIFGLILFGQGVYGIVKKDSTQVNKDDETTTISLQQNNSGEVIINVNSQTIISELIYYWNSEASQTISGNGNTTMQQIITMPAGQNTLTVKTIDVNGKQKTETQIFKLDVDKPNISLSVIGNKIKIAVDSKADLAYVTYKWNNEQEKKMDMTTFEDKTKFETEIEIQKGKNTLMITAVDIYENKSEKSQEINGISKPVIEPTINEPYITFTVTSEEDDIKTIEFFYNGKNYKITEDAIKKSQNAKKVSYKLTLEKGKNTLIVKATTQNGGTAQEGWTYEKK